MKAFLLTTCLCLCIFSTLKAQSINSPFQEIDESVLMDAQNKAERILTPAKYKSLILDVDKLGQILKSAPMDRAVEKKQSLPFEVLLSNGESEAFYLVEYNMMEPDLADKFPSFKTYFGYGINDPTRRIRLDWTSNGLNAMVQLPEGISFIKPYAHGNTKYYLTYNERDLPFNTESFECGVVAEQSITATNAKNVSTTGNCDLRTYRLAVPVTGEFATNTLGASSAGTAADDAIVASHIVTSINQINGWFERDVAARFILIANLTDIFYYNGVTDPYTNGNATTMLNENVSNLNATIGNSNFDVGHVLGWNGGTSNGIAGINVLCTAVKAKGVTRANAASINQSRFLKVWAHEMGHQFGATHTQNEDCQRSLNSSVEPGAGTTIMSYVTTSSCVHQIQNFPDYYFHAFSIDQMSSRILTATCGNVLPNSNNTPTVYAGADVTVPSSTPLLLEAVATDIDGDSLTFTWEQYNSEISEAIPPASTNTQGPNFRSFPPSNESGRYLPNLADVIAGNAPTWEVLPSVARTMDFRVTVRDNSTNDSPCTGKDDIVITTVADGPFMVTSPTSGSVIWMEGETHTVTWEVANTNVAPVACENVDVLLSYDGGYTYPILLANNVPNNGMTNIAVPIGISTASRVQVRCSDNIFYNISAANFDIQASVGPSFLLNLPISSATICPGDILNMAVTTSSLSGFTEEVTLSATNLPGSSSGTFASPNLLAGTGTTFDLNNTADLVEGNYIFTITATSNSIVRSFNYLLTVSDPAGLTILEQPGDNAIEQGLIPTFSWLPKPNATTYDIQISKDPTFTTLDVNETVTTDFYSPDFPLEILTNYYWRVRAATNCGDTPWSASHEFTTSDCAATFIQNTPEAISPNGTSIINSVLSISGSGVIEELEVSNIIGTHNWTGDLKVELIAPDGITEAVLWDVACGNGSDFNLSFSDAATDYINDAPCNPLGQGGIFIPEESLAVFDNMPVAGDWTLRISDNGFGNGGELQSWRLDFCSLIVLPIDLLSFDAFAYKNSIQLNWKTANEINNKGFTIERRSENEDEFSTIGAVPATDNPQEVNFYKYVDEEIRSGIQYYYRLRQNDLNGNFDYSEIRTAKLESTNLALHVYPSPVQEKLFGSLNATPESETILHLYDLNGRLLKQQIASGNQFVMNMIEFPNGIYILKAHHDNGRSEIIKVVVDR